MDAMHWTDFLTAIGTGLFVWILLMLTGSYLDGRRQNSYKDYVRRHRQDLED